MTTPATSSRVPPLEVQRLSVAGSPSLDLAIPSGRVVGLAGPYSSRTLAAIAQHQPAETGRILVDGLPVEHIDEALDAGLVFVPSHNRLAASFTAYENVLLPLLRRHRPTASTRAADALASVGLEASARHLPEELSAGQQQRVAIARALAAQPRVLLGDEVTSNLDPINRTRILSLLEVLRGTGAVVLLASDDPVVIDFCDAVVNQP